MLPQLKHKITIQKQNLDAHNRCKDFRNRRRKNKIPISKMILLYFVNMHWENYKKKSDIFYVSFIIFNIFWGLAATQLNNLC